MAKSGSKLLIIVLTIAIIVLLLPFGIDIINYFKNQKAIENVPNTDYGKIILWDDADLLTEEEENALIENDLLPITSYSPISFVTIDDSLGYTTEEYATALLEYIYEGGSGIVLLIDMDNRYIYIRTDNGNSTLSVAKCNTITDNIYEYASDGDFYQCAKEGLDQIYYVMAGISIPQPMKHMSNLLIAIMISLFLTFVSAVNKTRIKKPIEVYSIDKNSTNDVNISNVTLKLTSSYTISNESSSSHGGGGFSGGGGGASRGGRR